MVKSVCEKAVLHWVGNNAEVDLNLKVSHLFVASTGSLGANPKS